MELQHFSDTLLNLEPRSQRFWTFFPPETHGKRRELASEEVGNYFWTEKKRAASPVSLGTLRSDNGDVHENVAEKKPSYHLKLFTIIAICPVTYNKGILAGAEERGTRSSWDRDGRIYRLAVLVPK